MSFLPVYTYFIALSLLASLTVFFIRRNNDNYLKLFPPFLLSTLVAESWGSYRSFVGEYNLSLYNFFTMFEFCFYLWMIRQMIINLKIKNAISKTIIIYAVLTMINIFFIQGMDTFHTITYALGCLLIVAYCIYYFLELFRFPKYIKLKNNPAFWICSGLLFFYCCGFPLYGLINYLGDLSPLIINNFDAIFTILNVFLYSLFAIAFLCRIKVRKYTL